MTEPLPTASGEPWHGTVNGYDRKKCKCEKCKKANSDYAKKLREKAKIAPITGDESWHGTERGYTFRNCRCLFCKKTASDLARKRRDLRRNKPVTGDEPWHGTRPGYAKHLCRCDKCKFASRIYTASKKYGISEDKIESLLFSSRCEICATETPPTQGWFIDHDHSCCSQKKYCGKCVRGLLCRHCNSLLGFANDDPEILKAAIAYLERYSA